ARPSPEPAFEAPGDASPFPADGAFDATGAGASATATAVSVEGAIAAGASLGADPDSGAVAGPSAGAGSAARLFSRGALPSDDFASAAFPSGVAFRIAEIKSDFFNRCVPETPSRDAISWSSVTTFPSSTSRSRV